MKIPRLAAIAAAAFLIGAGVAGTAVGATAASGNKSYYSSNGVSYWNQANAYDGTPSANGYACTTVAKNGNGTVPAGWMATNARAFQGSALRIETGYQFTSTSEASRASCANTRGVFTGQFYSYGVTAAYNGNGNSYFYTYQSPTQNQG